MAQPNVAMRQNGTARRYRVIRTVDGRTTAKDFAYFADAAIHVRVLRRIDPAGSLASVVML
jgi:hypothetical protein